MIIGLGAPYLRNKQQVASEMGEFPFLPFTDRKDEVLALSYPSEKLLLKEYHNYVSTLEKYGIGVLRADPDAAYSFDYTCPRDIGFVIGEVFYISSMAVRSRSQEYKTILKHLKKIDTNNIIHAPQNTKLEGGDIIVLDAQTILIGINQRTDQKGYEFLEKNLIKNGYNCIPVLHNKLHLDCCLNPLGMGHLLIHPESLEGNSEKTWNILKNFEWIQVNAIEREHLATNVLSINSHTLIARNHPACSRVTKAIQNHGYTVESIEFNGVPATGGSFRCASLALTRQD